MQIEIQECSELLAEMMKDHPDYRRYLDISAQLEEDPELAARVHAFRKRNYKLQNSSADPEQEMLNMAHEYQELIRKPLVGEYFEAEAGVCRMLQEVKEYLNSEIQLPEL